MVGTDTVDLELFLLGRVGGVVGAPLRKDVLAPTWERLTYSSPNHTRWLQKSKQCETVELEACPVNTALGSIAWTLVSFRLRGTSKS